jgi:hypothetical protein
LTKMMMTTSALLAAVQVKGCMTVLLATSAKELVVGLNSTGMMTMSKEAMLTAEVAVLTELVRVLSDKVNELEAKQEQGEPVAIPDCGEAGHDDGCCGNAQCLPSARRTTPQQRKPLTEWEIVKLWQKQNGDVVVNFCRAIEAAHGIKE